MAHVWSGFDFSPAHQVSDRRHGSGQTAVIKRYLPVADIMVVGLTTSNEKFSCHFKQTENENGWCLFYVSPETGGSKKFRKGIRRIT